MEPRNRDEFARILRRAGYQAEKKPMLQEFHLRALRCVEILMLGVSMDRLVAY